MCFAAGAGIFGVVGVFFGYSLAHSNQPAFFLRNLSKTDIPKIRIETDVGESYDFGSLAHDASRLIKITGREKSAWIVIYTESGQKRESKKLYVTSEGIIYGVITDSDIIVDYAL